MSEENRVNETDQASGVPAQGKAPDMDAYMEQHKAHLRKQVKIIVAVFAAFTIYMVWFMMHL